MQHATQPFFSIDTEQRRAPRDKVRLSARVQSSSRFSFDSLASDSADVTDVTVNDLSQGSISTGDSGRLAIGSIVRLQVPLVGWRDAEVRWMRDGQAGCRFLVPLTQHQLRLAIASSPAVISAFPGFAEQIGQEARAELSRFGPDTIRRARLPTIQPGLDGDRRDRWTVLFCTSFITIIMATLWTILIVLSL
ncbi:MAG: PilZ protein [Rhizorhabdus sp.]|nr:PilZ protein [Rhizorhabdus sp.]